MSHFLLSCDPCDGCNNEYNDMVHIHKEVDGKK